MLLLIISCSVIIADTEHLLILKIWTNQSLFRQTKLKKEREIENTQRYLERAIISVRSKKELAISPDEKAKYTLSVKKAVSTYKGYCKKNDLVYEEWRTEI